jgi:hypothetical protein
VSSRAFHRLLPPALCALVVASSAALAQTPDAPIRAELSVRLRWIPAEYGEQFVKGEGVLLRGEPVDLELRVSNFRSVGPETTAVETDWFRRITVRIREGRRNGDAAFRSVACRFLPNARGAVGITRTHNMLLLPRGARITETCRLDLLPADLSAGVHTIEVNWGPGADAVRLRNVIPQDLPRLLELEYRDVKTEGDELDRSLHLAQRAIDDGQLDVARKIIESVLNVEPLSTTGLILRGHAKLAVGQCRSAAQDWELASNILENNSDVLNLRNVGTMRLMDEDGRRRAVNMWRSRARELGCR